MIKIKYLRLPLALLVILALQAASVRAQTPDTGARLTPEQREARIAACKADPEKCRLESKARHDQWCNSDPERCKQIRARIEQRIAACKAEPEKCQAQRQARFEQRFKEADSDGNGMISRSEAEKAMPRLRHHFELIDADHDGQISRDEIDADRKARAQRHQRRMERPTI